MPDTNLTALKAYVDHRLRQYAVSAAIGFAILLGGVGFAVHAAGQSTEVNSELICGIVVRLDSANQKSYERGKITLAQREEARQVYLTLREASPIDCTTIDLPVSDK